MQQLTLFEVPAIEKAGNRRRSRTVATGDDSITSRQERLDKRSRTLVARYYYWTEIKRRRFDDVLLILSDREFFVESRTISNTLIEKDDYYNELCRDKVTRRKLKQLYPSYCWD